MAAKATHEPQTAEPLCEPEPLLLMSLHFPFADGRGGGPIAAPPARLFAGPRHWPAAQAGTTHLNDMWQVALSTVSGMRAAGRYRLQ